MSNTIFVITAMSASDEDYGAWCRHRTWGWYSTFAEAEKAVESNVGDMAEAASYNYIVIEEFSEGVGAYSTQAFWYKYSPIDEVFRKILEPKWARYTCNWGMG